MIEQLQALDAALTKRGVKSMVYHSGGGCMVVTVYPDAVDHLTSDGQYQYRYMVGVDDEVGTWGYDAYDADDYIESGELSGTVDEIADAVAAMPREV